jgi:hypothetical protein
MLIWASDMPVWTHRIYQNECRHFKHLLFRNKNRYTDGFCSITKNYNSSTDTSCMSIPIEVKYSRKNRTGCGMQKGPQEHRRRYRQFRDCQCDGKKAFCWAA